MLHEPEANLVSPQLMLLWIVTEQEKCLNVQDIGTMPFVEAGHMHSLSISDACSHCLLESIAKVVAGRGCAEVRAALLSTFGERSRFVNCKTRR